MRNLFIMCLLVLLLTGTAFADIVATYKFQDGETLTLATRDSRHVRMDTSPDSFTLLQGDKVYAVNRDDNGQWMVIDMNQIRSMTSGGFTGLFQGGTAAGNSCSPTYEKTGRTEKIAGYTGTVYNIKVMEDGQSIRREQAVMSTHPDIRKLNEAWCAIAGKMSQMMGSEMSRHIETAVQAGYGGMLRYGTDMCLESLKKPSLDISYYQIPKEARPMEMGTIPGFKAKRETTPAPVSRNSAPGALEQDARDVGTAARQEIKDATIDEVKEGVRNLFQSIFD